MGETMRAVVRDVYGSVDVLRIEETGRQAGRRRARGVGARACGGRRPGRLAPDGRDAVCDAPGRVRPSGAEEPIARIRRGRTSRGCRRRDAGPFRPGDAVLGTCRGSFADFAVARADRLAAKPDEVSFEQAAASPDLRLHRPAGGSQPRQGRGRSARPDHRCGRRRRDVLSADRAKTDGAEVTGVCGTAKTELVRLDRC